MVAAEIVLILIGLVMIGVSFYITEKLSQQDIDQISLMSEKELKVIAEKQVKSIKNEVETSVNVFVDEALEVTQRGLEKLGMEEHLRSLASLSLLGNFVGMLTDSRSFLSYTRHEYFRRILCNLIGTWVEEGEYPDDANALREIVKGISFYNAKRFFGLEGLI